MVLEFSLKIFHPRDFHMVLFNIGKCIHNGNNGICQIVQVKIKTTSKPVLKWPAFTALIPARITTE